MCTHVLTCILKTERQDFIRVDMEPGLRAEVGTGRHLPGLLFAVPLSHIQWSEDTDHLDLSLKESIK